MPIVTVSSKFQVVIPRSIRKPMGLHPGDKLCVALKGTRLEMVPMPMLDQIQPDPQGCGTEIQNVLNDAQRS